MENASILTIVISAILVNNFVLSRFLGICSFIGISQKVETALGLGLADIFVMAMASVFAYFAEVYILEYFNIQYLRVVMYILIIASLVQFVEIVLKGSSVALSGAGNLFAPHYDKLCRTRCCTSQCAVQLQSRSERCS